MDKYIKIIRCGIVAALVILAFMLGQKTTKRTKIDEKVRYVTVHDTVNVFDPVCMKQFIVGFVDVPVEVDRIREVHDSVFVSLAVEKKVYGDSTYRAVVSGIRPELESLEIFRKTEYVYKTETKTVTKKNAFSLGVTAGAGVVYDARKGVAWGPGLTVGLQYRF